MSTIPLDGDNSVVFLYLENAWKPIACITSNSLSSVVEVRERQTKCNPGVIEKSAGTFSYTIDVEGEYIDTTTVGGDDAKASHDALLILQISKELQTWKIDTNLTDVNSTKYYGQALLTDLSADFPAGENATFSVTLDGSGVIEFTDPTATPSV